MNVKNILGVIVGITLVTTMQVTILMVQYADGLLSGTEPIPADRRAPPAISSDNVYVVWWTDKGTPNSNGEVMFRASTDGGQTFGDKINLSNTTNADSTRAEIDSDADSVVVIWWETNQTSDTPVMKVSNDNGATFGPMLVLATNGTIGEGGEAPEEAE
jgi:hypothetical protein